MEKCAEKYDRKHVTGCPQEDRCGSEQLACRQEKYDHPSQNSQSGPRIPRQDGPDARGSV